MPHNNTPPPLRYLSLFSGVGGFDLGFDRAGMTCTGQVEYDEKARAVLARHWPDVKRINDVREAQGDEFGTVDLICGGFPCQDVSVAGRRAGLAGERSGLWYEFHRLIDRVRPRWVVIENVPGLLSSHGGADFAVILRGLVECGYGVAWRVLDAQYFGVPQRRRRVFIVGSLGDGRAAEVLFEREGGAGNPAPGGEARPESTTYAIRRAQTSSNGWGIQRDVTHTLDETGGDFVSYVMAHGQGNAEVVKDGEPSLTANHEAPIVTTTFNGYTGGADDNDAQGGHLVAATLNSGGNNGGFRSEPGEHLVAVPLRAEGHDASEDGTGRQNLIPVYAFTERTRASGATLEAQADLAYALLNPGAGARTQSRNIAGSFGVRRLTPVECERLQGFPDNWTAGQSDSARYRQMGNAVAVPVAEWIGRRIMEANYG